MYVGHHWDTVFSQRFPAGHGFAAHGAAAVNKITSSFILSAEMSVEVFANNATLTILTYLKYSSTLYFNLEEIISCVWGHVSFLNQCM